MSHIPTSNVTVYRQYRDPSRKLSQNGSATVLEAQGQFTRPKRVHFHLKYWRQQLLVRTRKCRQLRKHGAYHRYSLIYLSDVAVHVKAVNAEIPCVSSIFSMQCFTTCLNYCDDIYIFVVAPSHDNISAQNLFPQIFLHTKILR